MVSRRAFNTGAALAAVTLALPQALRAQSLPRQTSLVVGFPAGGGMDFVGRLVAESLRSRLGSMVVVENKAGATGTISAEAVRSSPPDGSTLLLGNSATMVLAPLTLPTVKYNSVTDFDQVMRLCDFPVACIASNATGAKNLQDLIVWFKAHPDQANFGTPGSGTLSHICGVQLGRVTGVKLTMVQYRGGAPLTTDLIGGHVPCGFTTAGDLVQQHRAGSLRIVAVTGHRRNPALPEVPTFAEQGVAGLEANAWIGFFLPKSTPAVITRQISDAMMALAGDPSIKTKLEAQAFDLNPMDAATFRSQIEKDYTLFKPLIALL